MTLEEAGAVMDILTVAYPQFFKNHTDGEKLMASRLWAEMFADDALPIVLSAVKSHIATDAKGFPPHIGAIKAAIVKLKRPDEMTEQEAWSLVANAIRNGIYGSEREFEALPPAVQKVVGSPVNLREWAMMDSDKVQSVVASNFMRSFRARAASEREMLALPSDVRRTMEQLSEGAKVPQLEEAGAGV